LREVATCRDVAQLALKPVAGRSVQVVDPATFIDHLVEATRDRNRLNAADLGA
jgi:hypothetical protein